MIDENINSLYLNINSLNTKLDDELKEIVSKLIQQELILKKINTKVNSLHRVSFKSEVIENKQIIDNSIDEINKLEDNDVFIIDYIDRNPQPSNSIMKKSP